MACSNITAGISLDCIDSSGGIDKVFIANGAVSGVTQTNGVVSAISVDGSPLDPSDFFKFEIPQQTGAFTESPTVSKENGTLFYTQDLTLVFNKMSAEKRNQLLLIAKSTDMVVVFKDNNGKYWSVGLRKGAFMSAGTTSSGTAFGDRSGYEITLSGVEVEPAFEVEASIVEA